jgi:multidrug efflux pump subunit AcrA (membrane-fusion protein)
MAQSERCWAATTIRIAVTVVAAALLAGCGDEAPETKPIRPVRTTTVGDLERIARRSFPGRAKAVREANLSFRVAGPLITFPAKVGDVVKAGDLLGRIDPTDFEVELRNVQAQLARAKASLAAMRKARPEHIRRLEAAVADATAQLNLAKTGYGRVMGMKAQDPGAVSQAMIDRATEAKARTEAGLRKAKEELAIGTAGARPEDIAAKEADIRSLAASVDAANNHLSYTNLKAPFAGKVTATYVENFEDVRAKQPVIRIVDPARMEMVVNVPENLIALADQVAEVWVVFDQYPDHKVSAEITEVGVEASEATRTYPLTLSLAQPEQFKIVAGMAGKAAGKPKSVPADQIGIEVPVTAVFDGDDPGTSCVWVVGDDQAIARRIVEIGGMTLRGVGIRKGLKPGERIVTAGVSYLEEGQKVRIDKE